MATAWKSVPRQFCRFFFFAHLKDEYKYLYVYKYVYIICIYIYICMQYACIHSNHFIYRTSYQTQDFRELYEQKTPETYTVTDVFEVQSRSLFTVPGKTPTTHLCWERNDWGESHIPRTSTWYDDTRGLGCFIPIFSTPPKNLPNIWFYKKSSLQVLVQSQKTQQ